METLILKNGTKQDLKLLIDIAKKIGLDLKVADKTTADKTTADKRKGLLAVAERLDKSVKPNDITIDEIVEECRIVRQENYEKRQKNNI